jgi:hypothetical protein
VIVIWGLSRAFEELHLGNEMKRIVQSENYCMEYEVVNELDALVKLFYDLEGEMNISVNS